MAKATHNLPHFYKRHYEAIALAMQSAKNEAFSDGQDEMVDHVIKLLADRLASDNCNFQRNRFIGACEPGANVRARTNGGSR